PARAARLERPDGQRLLSSRGAVLYFWQEAGSEKRGADRLATVSGRSTAERAGGIAQEGRGTATTAEAAATTATAKRSIQAGPESAGTTIAAKPAKRGLPEPKESGPKQTTAASRQGPKSKAAAGAATTSRATSREHQPGFRTKRRRGKLCRRADDAGT